MNGNIFVQLFLSDLDEKMTLASYKRERNKNKAAPIIYSICSPRVPRHVQVKKAYLFIILALEASNWSRITFYILTNVLTAIFERFAPNV